MHLLQALVLVPHLVHQDLVFPLLLGHLRHRGLALLPLPLEFLVVGFLEDGLH
jgi:hypothetical protein